ncbi:MAG: hypothetical protein ACLR7U_11580 [Ruthenibacterium lactatiformans]
MLAGFIGIHEEGSIGMLEVLPAIGGAAWLRPEAEPSARTEGGRYPYCQVIEGNTASMELQKSWVWNFQMGLCIGCSKIFELPEDMFYLENHSHLCYN